MSTTKRHTETRRIEAETTVWIGGEHYHADRKGMPACPELLGNADEATISEAADEGLDPCGQCNPVDYRGAQLVATDGGADVSDDLREAIDALEGVNWRQVPTISVVEVAAFQERLREADEVLELEEQSRRSFSGVGRVDQ